MADPDVPAQKRPRLDSGNPAYNGHGRPPPPPPPPPPHIQQPSRHPSHPIPAQASPSPSSHYYPPHSLPPPSQPSYTPQAQGYPGPLPSPSLPPTDIRLFSDPRNIPSPGHRPHGVAGTVPVTVSQDNISTYRAPPTPQSTAPPEPPNSRSTSISVDIRSQPPPHGMEHGPHQPWPMNPDHRPNGMSNGYSHTISPPNSNESSFHPPSGPQYGQPVGAYTPGQYMNQYSSAAQQVRRKQVRATQACNHCRARKQKCDEARPCQFCRENNFDCQYKDVPPPKQDRSMMQLQDSVNALSDVLKNFVGDFNIWKQTVETRLPPTRGLDMTPTHASPEANFAPPSKEHNTSTWPTPTIQGRGQNLRVSNMKMESPVVSYSSMSPGAGQVSTPGRHDTMLAPPQQPATPADSVRSDRSRAAEGVPKEKSGLQSDHTTPAHKLLEEWPSMHAFYKNVDYLNRLLENGHEVSDYPMQLEQSRGLIRVWGVGEGQDLNDGAQGPGSPESNESDAPSPAPGKEGLWGHPPIDHSSPGTANGDIPRDHPGYDGGLGPDGRPNFHSRILWELHDSYITNMHNLHPFLNPSKLRRMIREFSEQYSPDVKAANTASPASHQLNPGVKRKRSISAFNDAYSSKGAIERSLRNAIVLLVLALGKVCAYHDKLPAPQSDRSSSSNGAWGYTRDPHYTNGSFTSESSDDSRPRNIDTLPGMAYFAYATDILGNQQGGNTVAHAQAMILAALYLSQYARVLESWSWINNACRITLVLIKADYHKLHRDFHFGPDSDQNKRSLSPKERYRLNLVMCVYWTCLQLESDILAEMSTLPTSGISRHQSDIMYPEGVYENVPVENGDSRDGPNDDRREGGRTDDPMLMYSSQIWLRVILNEAHNALYGAGGRKGFDTTNINEVTEHAKSHVNVLESWRRVLPPTLAWSDDDPPATDLNIARLRAKYYGGLYMILRPYLRIANHTIELPPASMSWSSQQNSPAPDSVATPTSRGMHLVELTESQRKIIAVAAQCIDCAFRSTIAFDRIGAAPDSPYEGFKSTRKRRLVVTNIFGTLHAQFGNMLVLAAVYKSNLHKYLPNQAQLTKANLTALLARTMNILSEVAPNSPILRMDLEILKNVQRQHNLY